MTTALKKKIPAPALKVVPAKGAPAKGVPAAPAKAIPAAAAKAAIPAAPAKAPVPAKPAIPVKAAAVKPTPVKPAAPKKHEFRAGDFVVYPTHGVGRIQKVDEQEVAGMKLELFVIAFEKDKMILRVPTLKAKAVGMRKLSTPDIVATALNTLKGRARIKRTMWSRRAQEYEAKINSGDPRSIAEVVRDLHRNAGQPDQSFSERQIYEAAMDRLAAELAALDKTDKPTAVTKLTDFLKTIA